MLVRQRFSGIVILLTLLAPLFAGATAQADVEPVRALLVTGGCCHDYETQKTLIQEGLEARAHVEVTVVHQGGSATDAKIALYDAPDWADGYDIVLHNECFAGVRDADWIDRILEPHRQGLPGVVLHCAMHSYKDPDDAWIAFCGVDSPGHGAHYGHEILTFDAEHPVMRTLGPGWYTEVGELYLIREVLPTVEPLAYSKQQEDQGEAHLSVWANHYEDTRVFGTTIGHHNETVGDPRYLDMLTRGTLWAAGKLQEAYLKDEQDTEPEMVNINYAREQAVTASSSQDGNPAEHGVDGNPNTRWCANGSATGEWLQVDLGEPRDVIGAEIEWEFANRTYHYRLEGSADGDAWETLVDGSENERTGTIEDTFEAEGIRYVRLTFLGAVEGGTWGSVRRLKILGDELVEAQEVDGPDPREQLLGQIDVPEGFEADIVATPPTVNYPTFLTAAPDGTLFVSSDKNGSLGREPLYGRVLRVRDVTGDGYADEVRMFIDDIDSPRGLVWDQDRLYLVHPPNLSVFTDEDGDGVADTQEVLVEGIAFDLDDRPADHTTNGLTMGIDGWLYIAVGDFGFMKATGTDGRELQLRGGGVVRVRPDGTGLEIYSRGARNIYRVGVDPQLNPFARDNTNDGGGWDVRLHHFTPLAQHGYPSLYMNFADEIIAPLADYGGGSGTASIYIDEPGLPEGYGDALYTNDWGRGSVFRHRLTPDGATFEIDQSEFIGIPRPVDMTVDANSNFYVASWQNGGFSYSDENVGFIARVRPENHDDAPAPDFANMDDADLVRLLASPSHTRRLHAQRTLLRRGLDSDTRTAVEALVRDADEALAPRIAGIFLLKQGLGVESHTLLTDLLDDAAVREFAIRALTDHQEQASELSPSLITPHLSDDDPRVRLAAANGLARIGKTEAAAPLTALLDDADPVVAHTAVKALVALEAADACFAVLDASDADEAQRHAALDVLKSLHQQRVVEGLMDRLGSTDHAAVRAEIFEALARLHHRPGEWEGDSWGTRPDTTGPYYQPAEWDQSDNIARVLRQTLAEAEGPDAVVLFEQLTRNQVTLENLADLARTNRDLLPAIVEQFAEGASLSADALSLLARVANADETAAAVRADAVAALARSHQPDALRHAVLGAAKLPQEVGNDAFERARRGFVRADNLSAGLAMFTEQADELTGDAALWADAALLVIANQDEAPAPAVQVVEAGWAEPARRARLLRAIGLIVRDATFADRVRAGLDDANAAVVQAARFSAEVLDLDIDAEPSEPQGPMIATLDAEQVLDAVGEAQGDAERGAQLFNSLGCAACHTTNQDQPLKGPYLGNASDVYSRAELAEAILQPNKEIAQGFATTIFTLEDGTQRVGFVAREGANTITVRDAAGQEIEVDAEAVTERQELERSLMPEGLMGASTVEDFASLLDYLDSLSNAPK